MIRSAAYARAALFSLCLGLAFTAYAGRDDRGNGGDRREEGRGKPEKAMGREGRQPAAPQRSNDFRRDFPQRRDDQPRRGPDERVQPARMHQQPERSRELAETWQRQRGWVQRGAWPGRNTWQANRARHWESEHRTWVQRGGYGGYYIPRDRFALYFGPTRFFRIHSRPVIYMGYPRFEYAGFSFLLVDPWPEYWAERWYDSDDVYIDYDDGYYLCNRRHPGIRLAITVAL